MIVFIGDKVRLHENFYGDNAEWLVVVDIKPYDICELSNSALVCASSEYIAEVVA